MLKRTILVSLTAVALGGLLGCQPEEKPADTTTTETASESTTTSTDSTTTGTDSITTSSESTTTSTESTTTETATQ